MKIASVSLSGNVGKTTIAKHLLKPNLPGALRVQLESTNSGDGKADAELSEDDLFEMVGELATADSSQNYVIDIGSTALDKILPQLAQLEFFMNEMDLWVIPVNADNKQQADSLRTINVLVDLGAAADRIILVPNHLQKMSAFEKTFGQIYAARDVGVHVANKPVLESHAFKGLHGKDASVYDLVRNPPDFAKLKAAATSFAEKQALGELMILHSTAKYAVANLDEVWEDIVKQTGIDVGAAA